MTALTERAYAKLNLTLDVLGRRPDGYHTLDSVMQAVSLHDTVTLRLGTGKPWKLDCRWDSPEKREPLPQDAENLAWKAAERFLAHIGRDAQGLEISILKRVPMQAGLGGGSSDAAAVLRALDRFYGMPLPLPALADFSAQVGSDVPFCVLGGTARVGGRGEQVAPFPAGGVLHYVICKPPCGIRTAELYGQIDHCEIALRPDTEAMCAALRDSDAPAVGKALCNVFQPPAIERYGQIGQICESLMRSGACGAQMTGSGSAVFGVFENAALAEAACAALASEYPQTFCASSV